MSEELKTDQSPTPCPKEVFRMVENFHNLIDTYRSNQYNETELRQEFILTSSKPWTLSVE
jgi:hypothetical protein